VGAENQTHKESEVATMTFKEFEKEMKRFEKDFFQTGSTRILEKIQKKMGDDNHTIWDFFSICGMFPYEYIEINPTGEKTQVKFNDLHDLYQYLDDRKKVA
jgi:hypothetical protein